MTGVVHAHSAQLPASNELPQHAILVEVTGTRAKRKGVDGVCYEVVANVEDAGPFVAGQTVHILRCIGFAATDRTVIDRVRVCVTRLERQTAFQMACEGDTEPIIKTGTDVALVIHRSIRIRVGWVGEKLIERPHAIGSGGVERHRFGTEVYGSAGKQANAVASKI